MTNKFKVLLAALVFTFMAATVAGATTLSQTDVLDALAAPNSTYDLSMSSDDGGNTAVNLTVASSSGGVPVFFGARSGGSLTNPSATPSGKGLFWLGSRGWTAANGWNSALTGMIGFNAAETFSNTGNGTYFFVSTTANGTTARAERLRILDNGNV